MRQISYRISLLYFVATLLLSYAVSPPVFAVDDNRRESLTIAPTDQRYEVSPGDIFSGKITVLNDGTVPVKFSTFSAPFSVQTRNYDQNFTDDKAARADAYKWIQLPQTKWDAAVRQTLNVPFTVRVPLDASPGGHYGAVIVESQPASSQEGSMVLKKQLAMKLYLTVRGNVVTQGETESISLDWFQTRTPLTATVSLTNTGNTDYVAKQLMEVSNALGNHLYRTEQEYNVMPNAPRDVSLDWRGASWLGLYKVKVTSIVLDKDAVKESYVLVTPVWFIVMVVIVCGAGVVYAIRKPRTSRK